MSLGLGKHGLMHSSGSSRFANAGRPTRTGIIRGIFLTRAHYFPVPPRLKPVNNPAESRSTPDKLRFIPVKPLQRPGCRRVPAEPQYTVKTQPALTGAIPASDAGRATATHRFHPGRRR
ncbi:hypothetical protein DPMN_149834 [Dreissena polymorpha]|uniref:Uncharacterized protein n=1 Tax=Dreissena polymorpha TaxID=45954 RepID=A0A9D4J1G6_DREPO|nr:hypothetical protein DPMN_149834 [Dreissena polymorpha]